MKNKYFNLAILSSVLAITACKKEAPVPNNDLQDLASSELIVNAPETVIESGILRFEDHTQMGETINSFGKMSMEQRLNWSQSNNFESQQMLKDRMQSLQLEFEAIEYSGLDEELTIEEMRNLGYEPKLNPELENQINRGMFRKHIEEDGALWFELNMDNKAITHVINYDGFVIIGEELYQYKNDMVKRMTYSGIDDLRTLESATSTQQDEGIYVYNGEGRSAAYTVGNIFNQTCNCWTWYNNSSNERFNHYVYMQSYWDSYQSKTYSNYQNIETAQKKLFGIWMQRNNYKPIYTLDGTWSWKLNNGLPAYSWYFSQGLGSGMYRNYGHSNGEIEQLFPFGWSALGLTSGSEVDIYNMHIHGTFWGGSSGYHTNYYF